MAEQIPNEEQQKAEPKIEGTYRKTRFYPQRPVRSFRDLEVYQNTFNASVNVMKSVVPKLGGKDFPLTSKIIDSCLAIPNLIAEAHSRRFEEGGSLELLDESMAQCNKMVVFLEQVRDIRSEELDRAVMEEIIKQYIFTRRKIFNLYKAWKKFQQEYYKQVVK